MFIDFLIFVFAPLCFLLCVIFSDSLKEGFRLGGLVVFIIFCFACIAAVR